MMVLDFVHARLDVIGGKPEHFNDFLSACSTTGTTYLVRSDSLAQTWRAVAVLARAVTEREATKQTALDCHLIKPTSPGSPAAPRFPFSGGSLPIIIVARLYY
jgi:hypothetical protein